MEYHVIEGTDSLAIVYVDRDLAVFANEVTLHYATSDLTAMGVDADKYEVAYTSVNMGDNGKYPITHLPI